MSKDKYPNIFSCQIEAIVSIILQIFFATYAVLKIREYLNSSFDLGRKYARIFFRELYLFREANSFREAQLEENCELRGTDNVQGQLFEHILAPNAGYCVYYPSNLFRNAHSFENWRIFSDIPQFQLGNIRSRDLLRPIARERKYLMDYKYYLLTESKVITGKSQTEALMSDRGLDVLTERQRGQYIKAEV